MGHRECGNDIGDSVINKQLEWWMSGYSHHVECEIQTVAFFPGGHGDQIPGQHSLVNMLLGSVVTFITTQKTYLHARIMCSLITRCNIHLFSLPCCTSSFKPIVKNLFPFVLLSGNRSIPSIIVKKGNGTNIILHYIRLAGLRGLRLLFIKPAVEKKNKKKLFKSVFAAEKVVNSPWVCKTLSFEFRDAFYWKELKRDLKWTRWLRATVLDIYIAGPHVMNKDSCFSSKFKFLHKMCLMQSAFNHLTDRSNCFHLTLSEDHEF